jgi:hypothetical protein
VSETIQWFDEVCRAYAERYEKLEEARELFVEWRSLRLKSLLRQLCGQLGDTQNLGPEDSPEEKLDEGYVEQGVRCSYSRMRTNYKCPTGITVSLGSPEFLEGEASVFGLELFGWFRMGTQREHPMYGRANRLALRNLPISDLDAINFVTNDGETYLYVLLGWCPMNVPEFSEVGFRAVVSLGVENFVRADAWVTQSYLEITKQKE